MILRIFGFLCLILLDGCCDGCDPQEGHRQYHYINKSSKDVVIARIHGFDKDPAHKSFSIAPNDTGRFWKNLKPNENEFGLFGRSGSLVDTVSLLFNSSTEKCFTFFGPVSDSSKDIRVESAYQFIDTLDSEGDLLYLYYYTINEDHYNNAGECPDKVLE